MSTDDERIGTWLGALGSDSPTPGGGAAAAVAAATGAALISMVGRLTIGKEGFEDVDERMRELVRRADTERGDFLRLADEDAEAFESVMSSFHLPKGTDDEKAERTLTIQAAYEAAAAVPLDLATRAVNLMELAEDATALGNPHAASDGYSAASLLHAATLAALANVRINAAGLKDEAKSQGLVAEADAIRERAGTLLSQVEEAFLLRLKS